MLYLDELSPDQDVQLTPEESRKLASPDYTTPDRFREIIRVWDSTAHRYRPTFLYEPHDATIRMCLAELAPILSRTSARGCICEDQAYNLRVALAETKTAVAGFQLSLDMLDHLPSDTLEALDPVAEDLFDTKQAAADAVKSVLTETDLVAYGVEIMHAVRSRLMDETVRQERIAYLQSQLALWETPPVRPAPQEGQVLCCPVCGQPYHYSLLELLTVEQRAISRIVTHLTGGPVCSADIPLVLAKMEEWLYALVHDVTATKKKLGTETLTMLLLTQIAEALTTHREEILTRVRAALTGTSAIEDSTAPPTAPVTPPDNSD